MTPSDPSSSVLFAEFSSKSLIQRKSGEKGDLDADFRGDSSSSSLMTANTFSSDLLPRSVILEPFSNLESENEMKSQKCSPLDSSPHFLESPRNGKTLPTEEEYDAAAKFDGAKLFSQFVPLEAQAGGRKHAVSEGWDSLLGWIAHWLLQTCPLASNPHTPISFVLMLSTPISFVITCLRIAETNEGGEGRWLLAKR